MKRRGFTLIELMVVIAIIIILAAIAIPNYLKMTERAKRSRVASDMATLATVLETFKTDWGVYPTAASAQDVSSTSTVAYVELSGTAGGGTGTPTVNTTSRTNAVGEAGGIDYIKGGTLTSMKNPWGRTTNMMYGSANGSKWVLYMDIDGTNYLTRSDSSSTVSTVSGAPSIP